MRVLLAILALAAGLPAQDSALSPQILLLSRIRNRMADNLRRQPNYTCLETIERTRRLPGGRGQMRDTLRMEVALVEGKEMFAWPGSRKFEDVDLRDMITSGTFGNGNYALHARNLFLSGVPAFTAKGATALRGRKVLQYDFRVARLVSGYHMTVGKMEGIVGYHGSFFADPQTLDIVRLEVFAEDIPPDLGVSAATDAVNYGWLEIGGTPFLLPIESELTMVTSGEEHRNFTRFSGCRQYAGESVLRFDDPLPEDAAEKIVEEIDIPANRELTIGLVAELDLDRAATGDTVEAEVRGNVRHDKRILIPKGARAVGRITRLEHYEDHTVFGVSFQEIAWPGWRAHVKLTLDRTLGVDAPQFTRYRPLYDARPGEGLVLIRPGRARLARGILFYWRT